MASNSGRRSGSSGRSSSRKRVVIGAEETVRVKYKNKSPQVEAERKRGRATGRASENGGSLGGRPATAAGRVAAEKRDERDRRRRTVARRRFLVGAGAVAVVAAVLWGAWAVWNSPAFSASDVRIIGGPHLRSADVLKLAAIAPGDTLPNLAKQEIEARIRTSPWVDSVSITRHLPHTVEITVTERKPAAAADVGGGASWLVSGDGHWIAPRTAEVTANLTPLRDLPPQSPVAGRKAASRELENALAVLQGLSPQMRSRLKAISAPTIDRTALLLKGDVQVFVGESRDIAKKDTIARAVLGREKNVVYINVRTVDRPVWRGLTPGP